MNVEDDPIATANAGSAASARDPIGAGVVPERIRPGADTSSRTESSPPGYGGETSAPQDRDGGAPEAGAMATSPRVRRKPRPVPRPDHASKEELVRNAFDEAERAASAAFDASSEATWRTDGRMHDLHGFAYVIAYGMSPWLRNLLKRSGEAESDGKGEWRFHRFRQVSTSHGIQANTAAADAARQVLRARLGDHANFYVESGLD